MGAMRQPAQRTLVVDDSVPNRKVVSKSLRKLKDYRVICHEAENGADAVEMVKQSLQTNPGNKFDPRVNYEDCKECYFDLILMDSHMPVLSGTDAIVQIRRDCNYMGQVHGVTGAEVDQSSMISAGADRVHVKPLKFTSLSRIVEGIVHLLVDLIC